MALSANTVWEVRANGAATNGGGFVSGASGTDYSQQDSAHATRTDIVIDATTDTDITSAADNFASDDVGNIINITSGTGFTTGRYEIVSVSAGVATLDRAVGTTGSTGGNGTLGGAMTITDANFDEIETENTVWVKADATHTITENINPAIQTTTGVIRLEGYNTTRGDRPTGTDRPLISCGANSFIVSAQWTDSHLRLTGTGTYVFGFTSARTNVLAYTHVENTSGTSNRDAILCGSSGNVMLAHCELESTNGNAIDMTSSGPDFTMYGCYIHDSTTGFVTNNNNMCSINHCIFDTCTTAIESNADDFIGQITNCTFYNSTTAIDLDQFTGVFMDNVIDSCTSGFEVDSDAPNYFDYNNWSNNTTDVTGVTKGGNATSASPGFADAAGGDFSPGAGIQATSSLGNFPGGLTTGYLDQGAVQHQDSGGGGGGGTIAKFGSF